MAASDDDSADLRPSPVKRQRVRRNTRKRDQKSELWFDVEAKGKLDAEVRSSVLRKQQQACSNSSRHAATAVDSGVGNIELIR